MKEQKAEKVISIVLLSLLLVVNLWMIVSSQQPWFLSSFTILFHEAGHVIFSPFGPILRALGGSLGELIIPSLFFISFMRRSQKAGMAFSVGWFSLSLYNIAIYVADAQSQLLELVGGPGGHDWHYLLGRFNVLAYDVIISQSIIILSLISCAYMLVLIHAYALEKVELKTPASLS